jgi:hypothetical protein
MGAQFLLAAAKTPHTSVQWSTLAWIVGAAVAAALIITVIVLVSRRPKSMEDGIAEFSRSLQAVAPSQRPVARPAQGQARPPERSVRATTEPSGTK